MVDDKTLNTLKSILCCLAGSVVVLDRSAGIVAGNSAFLDFQFRNSISTDRDSDFVALLRLEDHWLFYAALEKADAGSRAFFEATAIASGRLGVSIMLWRDNYFIAEITPGLESRTPCCSGEGFSDIDIPLRSIFDSSGTGLALVSLDGRWLRVNAVISKMLGYSEAQLQTTTFMALTHPEDREVGKPLIEELKLGTRSGATLHKRYIHRDGQVVWVRLTVGLVRDGMGQPCCFVSQLEDITENWELRETLMGSELKFLTLAQNSPNIIVRYDCNLLRTYVNPTFLRLTGLSYAESIGVSPSEDAGEYLHQLRHVLKTGKTAQFFSSWTVADGSNYVSCAVSLMVERSNTGAVVGLLALAHDITLLHIQQVLEDARLRIFEKMASGAPLEETLELLVNYLHLALPHWSCSVTLVEPQGFSPTTCIPHSLPPIHAHAEVWSESIVGKQGQILGAFQLSQALRLAPDESDIQRVRQTCHIAAIAIERWRSESLLRERERRYRNIFDHTLDMLCLLNVTTLDCVRCVEVNPALLEALGKTHIDVIGQTLEVIVGRLSAQKIQALCGQ